MSKIEVALPLVLYDPTGVQVREYRYYKFPMPQLTILPPKDAALHLPPNDLEVELHVERIVYFHDTDIWTIWCAAERHNRQLEDEKELFYELDELLKAAGWERV